MGMGEGQRSGKEGTVVGGQESGVRERQESVVRERQWSVVRSQGSGVRGQELRRKG